MQTMNKKDLTILIVEDDNSTRLFLQHLMQKKYQVVAQSDGWGAIHWLQAGNRPALILLDMSMPGLNGKDFLNAMRQSGIHRTIPVIVISGSTIPKEIEELPLTEKDAMFSKPFNPDELYDKVATILNNSIATIK